MKLFSKKYILIAGTVATIGAPIATIVSCNPKDDADNTIAIVVSDQTNPFFQQIIDAARKEAKIQGYKLAVFDSGDDLSSETTKIDNIITKKYAGVIFNPINEIGSKASAVKLFKAKIPYTLVDRSLKDDKNYLAVVATDNAKSAQSVVEAGLKYITSKAKTIINDKKILSAHLQGKDGAAAAIARNNGFINAMESWNNDVVNVDQKIDNGKRNYIADWDTTKANTQVSTWKTQINDLGFIFSENDNMALGAIKAYSSSSSYPLIVGFDGLDAAITKIDEGKMYATVKQDTALMGKLSIDIISENLKKDNSITDKFDNTKNTPQPIDLPGVIYKNDNWPSAKS